MKIKLGGRGGAPAKEVRRVRGWAQGRVLDPRSLFQPWGGAKWHYARRGPPAFFDVRFSGAEMIPKRYAVDPLERERCDAKQPVTADSMSITHRGVCW